MRRVLSLAIAAVALSTSLALPAGAAAKAKPATLTLRAHSKLQHVASIDNPPAGPAAGDVLVFTERLLSASGRPIGTDAATCTALFDQRSLCTGAYLLRGGQLFVSLVQPGLTGSRDYDQAITGGTGRYARATGTVTVHQRPSGDRFVFNIRMPTS
jgi:hypothetical protein